MNSAVPLTNCFPLADASALAHGKKLTPLELEWELVEAVRQGSADAFAQLLRKYQRLVFGYLHARRPPQADVDDLCQEVFVRCYLCREQFPTSVPVGAWLLGIARNVLRECLRLQTRRREISWTDVCLELDELTPYAVPELEVLSYLPRCLESLGPTARQAIDAYYAAGRSVQAIAQQMRRSEGAVKLLLHRSRQALKHCLERNLAAQERA